MADNYKMFLFDDKKDTEQPKVAKPRNGKKKAVESVDPKYIIDEKEFEPIVIDSSLVYETGRIKSGERDKARRALDSLVRETIERKETQITEEIPLALKDEAQSDTEKKVLNFEGLMECSDFYADNSLNDVYKKNADKIPEHKEANLPVIPKPLYQNREHYDNQADISAQLKAHAILTVASTKYVPEESISKKILKLAMRLTFFPFYNPKKKGVITSSGGLFQTRKELELMASAARERMIEKERKAEAIRKEIEEERKIKNVLSLADDLDKGIEIDHFASHQEIRKDTNKNTFDKEDSDFII